MPFPPAAGFPIGMFVPGVALAPRVDPRARAGIFNQSRWTRFAAHRDGVSRTNFVSC